MKMQDYLEDSRVPLISHPIAIASHLWLMETKTNHYLCDKVLGVIYLKRD